MPTKLTFDIKRITEVKEIPGLPPIIETHDELMSIEDAVGGWENSAVIITIENNRFLLDPNVLRKAIGFFTKTD